MLGGLPALYDGAEVLLKRVFGTPADRIGARPVLLGGLIAFAATSAAFVLADNTALLWLARLGQRVAASAFSRPPRPSSPGSTQLPSAAGRSAPTASARASVTPQGPLLGGVTVAAGGLTLLFAVMTALAIAVAVWALVAVPTVPPLPRSRQTSSTWSVD